MTNKISLVLKREYIQRVRRKSFIISTILMPLLMLGLMMTPALVMTLTGPENKKIAVIDNSHIIAPALQTDGEMQFITVDEPIDQIKDNEEYEAILVIGKDIISDPNDVTFYTRGSASIKTESFISGQLSAIIEQHRLSQYKIDNLPQILADVKADVSMKTLRIDREEEETTSSIVSYLVGMIMSLMLYMFIMLYGQMVMNSIIEEKNNRVLEVMVSSIKPYQLMLGKILGIGAVAITQILIWAILICSFTTWVMPSMVGSLFNTTQDIDLLQAITMLGDTGYILTIFGYLTLFLIGGYLFYSAIYASIGSAVDNAQDASQLQSIAIVPIILGMVFSMSVIQDPNSTMAVWLSMIPLTSPMVMMARVPFGIPTIEIIMSLMILYICMLLMIWVAAKIYRVGIFMYGKKPNIREIITWTRYK